MVSENVGEWELCCCLLLVWWMHLAREVPEFCEETLRQVAGDGQIFFKWEDVMFSAIWRQTSNVWNSAMFSMVKMVHVWIDMNIWKQCVERSSQKPLQYLVFCRFSPYMPHWTQRMYVSRRQGTQFLPPGSPPEGESSICSVVPTRPIHHPTKSHSVKR